MFNAAGILNGDFLRDSKLCKPRGEQFMALIDHFRNAFSTLGQIDKTCIRHGDIVIFPQIFHCDTHTRFLKAQFVCNIDGAHDRKFSAKDQYGF